MFLSEKGSRLILIASKLFNGITYSVVWILTLASKLWETEQKGVNTVHSGIYVLSPTTERKEYDKTLGRDDQQTCQLLKANHRTATFGLCPMSYYAYWLDDSMLARSKSACFGFLKWKSKGT